MQSLHAHGVRYVVVGSYSAIAQGVEGIPETDIDVTPDPDPVNLQHLAQALAELGAREASIDIDYEEPLMIESILEDPGIISTSRFWTFLTPHGQVDIVMSPEGFPAGYEALIDRAKIVVVSDPSVGSPLELRCAHVDDVRHSKQLLGRSKDLEALRHFPPPQSSLEKP